MADQDWLAQRFEEHRAPRSASQSGTKRSSTSASYSIPSNCAGHEALDTAPDLLVTEISRFLGDHTLPTTYQ